MRFFHVADVHLGAEPDKGFPWSEDRGREIWDSFRRLIQQVGERKADLFLIAGDLFHRQPLLKELKEINYLFSTIPHTEIVLMAGNHDYLKKDSCYLKYPWEPNVHCLWGREEPCVELPRLGTAVYGISYDRKEIRDPLYHHIHAAGKQPIEILLAHGGDERHIPFSVQILERSGFDYVALGHIHKPDILIPDKIAYAGALEPLDRNDTRSHGYIEGTIQTTGKKAEVKIQFVPFALRAYRNLSISVDETTTQYELEQKVVQMLKKEKQNLCCLKLEGSRAMDAFFDFNRFYKLGNVRDVQDMTHPSYQKEVLKQKYGGTLIEAYAEAFAHKNLTEKEKKAFAYGIEALLEAREESL